MARVKKSNTLVSNLSGKFGDQIIFKQYDYGCVVSKYPDMSRVRRTVRQDLGTNKFKEAIFYAKIVLQDEKLRKQYAKKAKKGQSVYHLAISEYMRK